MLLQTAIVVPFVAAAMFGFSEVNGLCGASHIGTLSPLRALDTRLWFRAMVAYTLGGVLSALLVGMCLGLLGDFLGLSPDWTVYALVPLAALLAVREIGWIRFPLPQVHRQTQKVWALQYGHTTGAAMWGGHIGLAFATVVRHGGIYVLAIVALSFEPLSAAILFVVYWVGRTLPIWITPWLTANDTQRDGGAISALVLSSESERALEHLAAVGLLCVGASALLLAIGR